MTISFGTPFLSFFPSDIEKCKNTRKNKSSAIPSTSVNRFVPLKKESFKTKNNKIVENNVKGIIFLTTLNLTFTVISNDETPRIKSIFAIFDPIIFPKFMSVVPSMAENIFIASSGREVPNAKTVNPRTNGFTPKRFPK